MSFRLNSGSRSACSLLSGEISTTPPKTPPLLRQPLAHQRVSDAYAAPRHGKQRAAVAVVGAAGAFQREGAAIEQLGEARGGAGARPAASRSASPLPQAGGETCGA